MASCASLRAAVAPLDPVGAGDGRAVHAGGACSPWCSRNGNSTALQTEARADRASAAHGRGPCVLHRRSLPRVFSHTVAAGTVAAMAAEGKLLPREAECKPAHNDVSAWHVHRVRWWHHRFLRSRTTCVRAPAPQLVAWHRTVLVMQASGRNRACRRDISGLMSRYLCASLDLWILYERV